MTIPWLLASAAAAILTAMTALWLLSVRLRDASIIDAAWGMGFVLVAWIYRLAVGTPGTLAQWLLLALVTVWGCRLSVHILVRNLGHGEDRRYAEMRARGGPSWWWRSLFTVFYLQAALILLISLPLLVSLGRDVSGLPGDASFWQLGVAGLSAADGPAGAWAILAWAGVVAWLVGFAFEAGGDLQLVRFKRNPANRGSVLRHGFWRYTRHPNYFGDAMVWWGHWLLAMAIALPGSTWRLSLASLTLLAPVIMNVLLLKVSGVALLEKDIGERRPGYRSYIESTPAFWPWLPKQVPDRSRAG